MTNVHGSAIAFGNRGVLIRGVPGSGKSELALRLIDSQGFGRGAKPLRAKLVADDQVLLVREGSGIVMHAPNSISGKMEIRGVGIIELPHKPKTKLVLVVDLKPQAEIERMPEADDLLTEILGLNIRRFSIDPNGSSALSIIRCLLS